MESSEFTMSHEDFPALPGAPANSGGVPAAIGDHPSGPGVPGGHPGQPGVVGLMGASDRMTSQGLHQDNSNLGVGNTVSQTAASDFPVSKRGGIQTSPDGRTFQKIDLCLRTGEHLVWNGLSSEQVF